MRPSPSGETVGVTAHRLLLRMLIALTAVVVVAILVDSSLAVEVRVIGVCIVALICWAYWKGWLIPG
jgi:hypothetical protein